MGKNFRNKTHGHRHGNGGRGNDNFRNKTSNFNKKYQNSQRRGENNEQRSREYVAKNNLSEDQVGITEYISKSVGFTGVVKARFSDFHVNEIDLEGNVIKLTDFTIPRPPDDSIELEETKKELQSTVTDEIWTQIEELIKSKDDKTVKIDVTELDKDKRTLVHKLVKQGFHSKIVSTTVDEADKKLIQIVKSKGRSDGNRSRWTWDGDYVHFVVHKENVDTVQAASDLAFALRMNPSLINYAGTKDKRAKTSQIFCIKKREPSQIVREIRRFPYMKIGNFEFKENNIRLGDLRGNRFKIALRHVDGDDEAIKESLENIKTKGFINYYGLQRFGNCASVPTYKVGIALLKADYKGAVELILKPRDDDPVFLKNIRETWWKNRNSAQASDMFRHDKFIEKKLLDGLAEYGESDYSSALRKLPRNMLLLYTHAYQSLIWNRIASRRITDFGFTLIPGDLVYRDESDVREVEEIAEEENVAEDNPEDEPVESIFKQKVRPLTAEDIASGKYTIFDIVIPLPGHDITYPANEVGKWYEEMLAEDDLSSEKLKHNVKTYSLAGSYRKLLVKPENMVYEFKLYESPTSNLIASDYEVMGNKKADESVPNGKFKALILEFSLPSATYATMFLREILKSDTSSANQAKICREEMEKTDAVTSCETEEAEEETDRIDGVNSPVKEEAEEEKDKTNGATSGVREEIATTDGVTCGEKEENPKEENAAEKRKSPVDETEENDAKKPRNV